ncbi:MAG: Gfo/Idh/MocA family oxidoreductase [Candidatus Latescibacterota bacterium]
MPEKTFPTSAKIIRVGVCGTGPFAFYGMFNSVINNTMRDYNNLNMRVTHIWGDDYHKNYKGSPEYVKKMIDFWNSDKQSPQGIAKACNIPNVCKDFHEMVNDVDAAMIMDFDRAYELSEPFLKRGLPIFICSPVAISVPECEKILDLAEKNGAAVFTGAYTQSLYENRLRNQFVKQDDISAFFAQTSFGFYTSYAPDSLEPVHWLVGPGVRTAAIHGWDGSKGYDPTGLPPFHIHLEYEPRKGNPPIQGTVVCGGHQKASEYYKVYYKDHKVLEGITMTNWGKHELTVRDFMMDIQQVFVTNKSLETREDILTKLRVLIAAYKSANEGNRPVLVSEVGDYRLPTVRIEKFNEIPK